MSELLTDHLTTEEIIERFESSDVAVLSPDEYDDNQVSFNVSFMAKGARYVGMVNTDAYQRALEEANKDLPLEFQGDSNAWIVTREDLNRPETLAEKLKSQQVDGFDRIFTRQVPVDQLLATPHAA